MNQPRASRIWRLSPGVWSAYRREGCGFSLLRISARRIFIFSDPVGSDSRASDNPLKKPSGRSSD